MGPYLLVLAKNSTTPYEKRLMDAGYAGPAPFRARVRPGKKQVSTSAQNLVNQSCLWVTVRVSVIW